jgi:hypothetical protein
LLEVSTALLKIGLAIKRSGVPMQRFGETLPTKTTQFSELPFVPLSLLVEPLRGTDESNFEDILREIFACLGRSPSTNHGEGGKRGLDLEKNHPHESTNPE